MQGALGVHINNNSLLNPLETRLSFENNGGPFLP